MSSTTATTPPSPAKPTVVLVHGAFADSSSWNGVIAELRREGHHVIAAANPLRGLHTDAEHLRSLLDGVDGPIVLAGHSYGGTVMSEAADGHPASRRWCTSPASSSRRARAPASSPRSSRGLGSGRPWTPCRSPPTAGAPRTCTSARTSSTGSSPPTSPGTSPS
ncbi:alpha/beta fold hydrolase [Kineococcus sp. T13]|uniref:alpha/beta fold hydrolase n=1 Tax=Kineococcus vitellinus TaxID=2696565 RepID=UPI001411B2F0|nr:alpha/beta fold hydrolase [Kineococcus vitellinus]